MARGFLKDGCYTRSELAEYLGVSPATIKLWLRQGKIPKPAGRLGRYYLWTQAEAAGLKTQIRRREKHAR